MTTLLVASGGGHLRQLHDLAPRLSGVDPDFTWVTWDAPQSRSLLSGHRAVFVRPTPPRSPVAVARNLDYALALWRDERVTALVTTGSQLVLPFLTVGRAKGRPCHFIESAARSEGPSLTARIASHIPGMSLYTQYQSWTDDRWRYVGSVFDGFRASRSRDVAPKRVVVTLGTMPKWQFRRLIEHCLRVLPDDSHVTWQTGATDVVGLGIDGRPSLSSAELEEATRAADVVISHAGVGSALTALRAGKFPILVPRSAPRDEHVDDHQRQIADELSQRGLALWREPESLTEADLRDAAATSVDRSQSVAPIELDSLRLRWSRRVRSR